MVVILLFVVMLVLLFLGVPVTMVIGGLSTVGMIVFGGGLQNLGIMVSQIYNQMASFTTVAIPCFIFLGVILEKTGIAAEAFDLLYKILGRIPGGLAVSSVLVCTLFGAMTGTAGASVLAMGIIALPAMLDRGYNKHMSLGAVAAGGCLGPIIPPSVLMVLYGLFTDESIGQMFAGGVFSGIFISLCFCIYIVIRSCIQKDCGPAIPKEERASAKEILKASKGLIAPIILIVIVLGSIFGGIATPTEAAAVGCVGVLVIAVIRRDLTWKIFKETTFKTVELSAMVVWIIYVSSMFSALLTKVGANKVITSVITGLDAPRWVILFAVMILMIILGMFMDPGAIIMITMPILQPIMVHELGYDSLWFGVLMVIIMVIGYISPPFGFNLFYLKQIVPEGVTMGDIYRGAIPYFLIMCVCAFLFVAFPGLITWLPRLVYG